MQTVLYRHFDEAGRLLYVGISLSAIARLAQHRSSSRWFDEIATVTLKRYPTLAEAKAAEQKAIRHERPIHNVAHSLTPPPRPPDPKQLATDDEQALQAFEPATRALYKRLTGEYAGEWRTVGGCASVLGVSELRLRRMIVDPGDRPIVFQGNDVLALGDRLLRGTEEIDPLWVLGSPLPSHMDFDPGLLKGRAGVLPSPVRGRE